MFSVRCKNALRAVLYLVTKCDLKCGAKEISAHLNIPAPFMAKTLQDLSRADKISSVKGKNGGFYLTEEQLSNNMMDVIIAIDGKDPLEECVLGLEACSNSNPCPLHSQAVKARQDFYHILSRTKISEMGKIINDENLRIS